MAIYALIFDNLIEENRRNYALITVAVIRTERMNSEMTQLTLGTKRKFTSFLLQIDVDDIFNPLGSMVTLHKNSNECNEVFSARASNGRRSWYIHV